MKKISPTSLALLIAIILSYSLLSYLSNSFIDPFLLSLYSSPAAIETTKTLILNGTANLFHFNSERHLQSEQLNVNVVLPIHENELILTQHGLLHLNITGNELTRTSDPLLFESNEIRCLKVSVELVHFSSRSNTQNIFVRLPVEGTSVRLIYFHHFFNVISIPAPC